MKVLETPRLILRPFTENDLLDFYEYAKVEGVGEMAGWKHHSSIEESKNILQLFLKGNEVYALELKATHKVIGSLGIHPRENPKFKPEEKNREIGYVLSKAYWGQGLMTEAVQRALQSCFDDLALDVVWVGHFLENDRSRRVIEKCGFSYFGPRRYFSKSLNKSFEERCYFLKKTSLAAIREKKHYNKN